MTERERIVAPKRALESFGQFPVLLSRLYRHKSVEMLDGEIAPSTTDKDESILCLLYNNQTFCTCFKSMLTHPLGIYGLLVVLRRRTPSLFVVVEVGRDGGGVVEYDKPDF